MSTPSYTIVNGNDDHTCNMADYDIERRVSGTASVDMLRHKWIKIHLTNEPDKIT